MLSSIFIFTFFCGASKVFMKVLGTFVKPFEEPERSAKIKIEVNFHFNTTLSNARDGTGSNGEVCVY